MENDEIGAVRAAISFKTKAEFERFLELMTYHVLELGEMKGFRIERSNYPGKSRKVDSEAAKTMGLEGGEV